MSTSIRAVVVALGFATLGLGGCGSKVPRYFITAQHHETVPEELDGQWFTREIILQNRLEGIELVYCPILDETQDGHVTVCRTAVVWEANHSRLTDAPSESDRAQGQAAAPAAAPAPAPVPAPPPAAPVETAPVPAPAR